MYIGVVRLFSACLMCLLLQGGYGQPGYGQQPYGQQGRNYIVAVSL